MKTLTPEELASGEWIWDEVVDDFINIHDPKPEPEEAEEKEPEIPTHAIVGMKWNGTKLS